MAVFGVPLSLNDAVKEYLSIDTRVPMMTLLRSRGTGHLKQRIHYRDSYNDFEDFKIFIVVQMTS
jgi:hypothetical protein